MNVITMRGDRRYYIKWDHCAIIPSISPLVGLCFRFAIFSRSNERRVKRLEVGELNSRLPPRQLEIRNVIPWGSRGYSSHHAYASSPGWLKGVKRQSHHCFHNTSRTKPSIYRWQHDVRGPKRYKIAGSMILM